MAGEMSRFDDATARMNASLMSVYGDSMTVRRGTFAYDLVGVFSTAVRSDAQFLPFGEARATALFRAAEFAATEAGHGDYIIRGDEEYRITDVIADDGGIATVTLGVPVP